MFGRSQTGVEYLILPRKCVLHLSEPLGSAGELGRVTYSGSYVLPGATPAGSQVALPDDLEKCCIEQVAYWYQRRTQLGLLSVSSEGGLGVVQKFDSSDLLPQVRATLMRCERWVN